MCELASEFGVHGIKFLNYLSNAWIDDLFTPQELKETQLKIFFEQLAMEREKYDINDLLIERSGTFGQDIYTATDNFECPCISDFVVLTPDDNVYSCLHLAKYGYEIGKYSDGKIMIRKNLEPNKKLCLAKYVRNKY